jgi:hypothetical protein
MNSRRHLKDQALLDLLSQSTNALNARLAAAYANQSPWVKQIAPRSRYLIRQMYHGTMNGTPLYTACQTGAKHLLRGELVKPSNPGGFVYGIWDSDERKLLSVWPNKKLAEGVLRLMQ